MRKLITLLTILLFVTSCDDGDIILVELEFDNTFETCGELVFYNVKELPAESISLQISSPATTLDEILELIYIDTDSILVVLANPITEGTIDGVNNLLNYRSYASYSDNLFCNDVPPSNLQITEDQSSISGNYTITTIYTEDDNDGIPAEMEDLNNNGNLYDDDTDGDGLPNFLDEDDDGDNVLTSTELIDYDMDDDDDDPLTDPQDTDGDGVPNYLDNDDDGDLVLTINEENITQDLNPSNDYTNPTIADYLNPQIATIVLATEYRPHNIKQTYEVSLIVDSITFPTLNQDVFDFGMLQDTRTSSTRTVTPDF
ncbi:hypothetical protein [Formosa maritima]|uniref:Calcium-binding protein n=1 Tax=Formosa maritima TaxID=2592046 RepID=A0A5D0GET0_9FLAO|nr:hypothetical protein [Formosa maritima]TYA56337.1 hypothetical protein FVF61_06250 [Formosa maritima]